MKEKVLQEITEKRDRYTKHFMLPEKGTAAAVYPEPVHYETESGWEEIDNRLEAVSKDGKECYQNKASDLQVCFAKQTGENTLVSMEKDGKKVSWTMEENVVLARSARQARTGKSSFQILTEEEFPKGPEELYEETWRKDIPEDEPTESSGDETGDEITILPPASEDTPADGGSKDMPEVKEIQQKMGVKHLTSEGMYEEILPGVDLHYTIQSQRLKENIRLKTAQAAEQELIFHLRYTDMEMKKEEDGSLGLYSENQRIFWFDKPYMYDAKGCVSQNVELVMETEEGGCKVTVSAEKEWLLAEDRSYPVIIDPMTETSKTKTNIEDTYIFTGGTDSSADPSSVYAYGSFVAGKSTALGNCRSLLRFRNLPDIGKGSILYAATMYLWQYEYSSYGIAKLPLVANEILNNWTEKDVRWHNQPSVSGNVLDYKEVGQVQNGNTITITPIGFDVTRLVRQWYNTGNNYGIMLRGMYENESDLTKTAFARFYASDYPKISTDQFPSGVFYYRNVNGLEDYQSYHEQSAGRAGNGHTNDFTGNQVWIHEDAVTTGGAMQAEISHVYNSSEAGTNLGQGYGWRLSCVQRLDTTGIKEYPYVYTDEDGTKHYFYKDTNDGNKLKDEDGLGLVITVESGYDDSYARTMETKDRVRYCFGKDGYLRFVRDLDENQIKYVYQTISGKQVISYVEDSGGARLEIQYETAGNTVRVSAVKDMAGRLTKYAYDSAGNLTSITYPDGKTSSFGYDASHRLTSVTNPDGYGLKYEYKNDFRVPRVSRIAEYGSGNKAGQEMKVSYANGNTTVFETPGLDGEIAQTGDNRKITYHFDNMGRPTDVMDQDGCANNYTYYTSGSKNHKLDKEGKVQKTVCHLLKNPLFDSAYGDGNWYQKNLTNGTRSSIAKAEGYAGTKSAKLTKTGAESEEGICQDVTLETGTYTFSAYLKTENAENSRAGLMILMPDGSRAEEASVISGTTDPEMENGWERHQLQFTLAAAGSVTVCAGITEGTGILYVSGAQLETGNAANKLNLITNPGFELGSTSQPDCWNYAGDVTGSRVAGVTGKGRCATISGRWDKSLYCSQTVHVSGKKDEVYSVSSWVKGCGIPGKKFSLSVKVTGTSGKEKWHHFNCNPNILDWQFVSGVFRTEEAYKEIQVYLYYDNQMNKVYYDGVQLIRDDGESYVYDGEGNLSGAKDAAEKSGFSYNKRGDLTRLGEIDGTAFEYGYDDKNHLKLAANSEGVRYSFEYNTKRVPVTEITDGELYYLREKSSGNYMDVRDGRTSSWTTVQLFAFNGTVSQRWRITKAEEGYWNLEPQNAPDMRLDLKDASTADGAAIQIFTDNGTDAQKWRMQKNSDGTWKILNKLTGTQKCITNEKKSTASGEALKHITVSDSHGGQSWYLEKVADEGQPVHMRVEGGRHLGAVTSERIYYIREKISGNYLDVQNGGTDSGSVIQLFPFNGTKAQQWKVTACDDGYFKLQPQNAPAMCLDVKHANTAEGTVIQIFADNGTDAQRWKLQPKSDGSYQISEKFTSDKKGLTNEKKSSEAKTPVTSCTLAEDNPGQCWYFEPADEGTISDAPADGLVVSVRVRHSGQYIDVHNYGTVEGNRVNQYYKNCKTNQMFRLKKREEKYYTMEPLHAPGMVLARATSADTLILQKYTAGAANQLFGFTEIEEGKGTGYLVICKAGEKELTVKGQSYTAGTELVFSDHSGTPTHKWWILESYSDRMESSMEYTSDGRQVKKITDGRGYSNTYAYDEKNRLLTLVTDAEGYTTTYDYDKNTDQLIRVKKNADGKDYVLQYTYEQDKIKTIIRNGVTYGYAYDAYGNQTGVTLNGKILKEVTYRNKNGLEDRLTFATGETLRNVYDAEERLTGQYLIHKDGTEEKLFTNVYDHYGNIAVHKDERTQLETHYQYDLIGRLLESRSTDGLKVKVAYDEKNRVAQKQYRVDGIGHQTRYLYGDVAKQQKPGLGYGMQIDGKTCIEYAYDLLGRCKKKTQTYPSGKKKEITYTYVPGAKEGTTTALIGTITENGKETAYTYDGRGNILEICTKELDTGKVTDHMLYTYTGMNQVIREEDAVRGRTFTYAYDLGGNLLENKKYYLVNGVEELRGTDTYTYSSGWKDQLTSFNGKAITYDAMGNPLSYMGMNLTWEKGRQLKTLKKSGTLSQYVYDNDGRRIQKTVGDKVIRFYLDGDKIIAQKEEGGERMDFLYDEKGTPFAFEYQGKMYFYQTSLQGDIIGIVDSEGSQVVVYRYDAWGEVLVSSDASGFGLAKINPLRYRGYYYDQETGLYYLQTRYYDPKVRRFLNADDASVLTKDPEQLTEKNLYAYCDDNPVMYRDDAGMFVITAAQVGLGVLGMVTNVATCYIAAKATGQEFGIGDLVIAAAAGFVGGCIKNNFYATVASILISGVGTTFYSLFCGDNLKTALWKGGMTIVCTAVSVSSLIGVKSDIPIVVNKISTGIFGMGNSLTTTGIVASFSHQKTNTKKNHTQNQRKSKSINKNSGKKQKERALRYFIFKMNQLRER